MSSSGEWLACSFMILALKTSGRAESSAWAWLAQSAGVDGATRQPCRYGSWPEYWDAWLRLRRLRCGSELPGLSELEHWFIHCSLVRYLIDCQSPVHQPGGGATGTQLEFVGVWKR